MLAVKVLLHCLSSQESVSLREDTYELCYNTACLLIGREEYEGALEKLQQAEGVCDACQVHLSHIF